MYAESFGLCVAPFDLTTDPRFLYLSPEHARAQAYLEYAVLKGDSIVVITGEIGVGKSTLIHDLSDRIYKNSDVVVVHHPHSNTVDFLQAILLEWGCKKPAASKFELLTQMRAELAARFALGTRTTLIIDEAQTLSADVLEELRMVADEEIGSEKPLSIVLVGQPCLSATLAGPNMEQFRQRIRLSFHLPALDEHGTTAYIKRRLDIAGADSRQIFTRETIPRIYKYTGGIPRLINVLADLSLTAAWMDRSHKVTALQVNEAIKELGWVPYARRRRFLHAMPRTEQWSGHISGIMDRTAQFLHLLCKKVLLKGKRVFGRAQNGAAHLSDKASTRSVRSAKQSNKSRLATLFSSQLQNGLTVHKNLIASVKQSMTNVAHENRDPTSDSRWLNPSAVRGAMAGFSIAAILSLAVLGPAISQFADAKLAVANTPEGLLPQTQLLTMNVLPAEAVHQSSTPSSALNPIPAAINLSQQGATLTTGGAARMNRDSVFPEIHPTSFSDPDKDSDEEQKLDAHGLQTAHWVLEQSPDRYVIQILAAKEVDVVDRFLRTAVNDHDIALYRHQRNQEQWYVLVRSKTYHSYDDASLASKKLPKLVLNAKPWIRPVNDVQADIRKATDLGALKSMM